MLANQSNFRQMSSTSNNISKSIDLDVTLTYELVGDQ
jgi:hypothetical protein